MAIVVLGSIQGFRDSQCQTTNHECNTQLFITIISTINMVLHP